MKGKNRSVPQFGMAFMDVICCGFGAILLLLVITEVSKPAIIEDEEKQKITKLQRTLTRLTDQQKLTDEELQHRLEEQQSASALLEKYQQELALLEAELQQSKQQKQKASAEARAQATASNSLANRLNSQPEKNESDNLVAGIPLDANYIIFVIDTSGSMVSYAWPLMLKVMEKILDSYPKVHGIQVINDMGVYLYPTYKGRWIPDTPIRRNAILKALARWLVYSNSSPVEGIEQAIKTYRKDNLDVAIYVLGDEFAGHSIAAVLAEVDHLNQAIPGLRQIRIHAIGFPVLVSTSGDNNTGVRFATLMRELTSRNEGAFIGLTTLKIGI